MNKIKNIWNENRVIIALTFIVLICIGIISGVMIRYFFGVSSSSYGDRLDSIKDVPFGEEQQNLIKDGYTSENLIEVNVDIRGKIVYVIAEFNEKVSMVEAQNITIDVYYSIEEKYRKLYDFNVTIVQKASENVSGYNLMGSKNVSGDNFVWSNNTPIEEE